MKNLEELSIKDQKTINGGDTIGDWFKDLLKPSPTIPYPTENSINF